MRHALLILILSVIASAVYSAPVVPLRGTLKDVTQEGETTTTTKVTTTTTNKVTSTTTVALTPKVYPRVASDLSETGSLDNTPGGVLSRSVAASDDSACGDSFTVWLDDKNEVPVVTIRCAAYTVVYMPDKNGEVGKPKYLKDEVTSVTITGARTEDLKSVSVKINGVDKSADLKDTAAEVKDAERLLAGNSGRLLSEDETQSTKLYSLQMKDGKKFDVYVPKKDDYTGYALLVDGKQIYSGVNSGVDGSNNGIFKLEGDKLLNNGRDVLSGSFGLSYVVPSILAIFAVFFML